MPTALHKDDSQELDRPPDLSQKLPKLTLLLESHLTQIAMSRTSTL